MSEIQTEEDVLKAAEQQDVTFINLWFPDVLGQLKSFNIHRDELETALYEGMGFDGSSIEGFMRIEESDLIARPDPNTYRELPYRPRDGNRVASMFCKIYKPNGRRFEGDSLWALERQQKRAEKLGFDHCYMGPELEFFLVESKDVPNLLDGGGYFGVADDAGRDVRREIILNCQEMGIRVEYSHHEVAPSQHEIDLRYKDALEMAMDAMTYRVVVKEIAGQQGFHATFMPKPVYGENGSGMHVHQSLFRGDKNSFFDKRGKFNLSRVAQHYIAGILRHAPEMAAVTNQWVNSYQRLVPGYEAPTELSWARRNRSTAVRVPMYKPKKEQATRVEVRFPDPACNLPLTFAMMLGAGLEGIEKKYRLSKPIEKNIYEMSPEERKRGRIVSLPGSLEEATSLLEQSELAGKVLGSHIHRSLVANQRQEWKEYYREVRGKDREDHLVTQYELEKLLPIL